jgi:rubrerythrin
LKDLKTKAISLGTAETVYGVVLKKTEMAVDVEATRARQAMIREARLAPREGRHLKVAPEDIKRKIMKFHEYLEIVEKHSEEEIIVCVKCGNPFCNSGENYKNFSVYRENDLENVAGRFLASGEKPFVTYQEYVCPGCGTLLEVDVLCRELEGEKSRVIWDIQINPLAPLPPRGGRGRGGDV